jgi:hypothetical protein
MTGRDDGSFYHENFLRGAPDLAREIKRVPIKLHAAVVSAKKTVTAAPMRAPNFDQQPPLPATKRAVVGAVGAGAIVGSASGTDSTAVSAAASSSIVADGLAALATSGPLGAVAFAGQDQRRNEFFASIQSNIVPSRSSDAPLVLAYFEHNEHELNLLKCRQLLLRLQMKQQIERQSLLAAVSRFRQQQNSNFLLRQLVQFQGQNESGR